MRQLFILLLCLASLSSLLSPPKPRAESISVSLRVGITEIIFSGYTSPYAFITIKQNDAVIGTTTATGTGEWSKTIETESYGIQTFSLYSVDTQGSVTPTISYTVNLDANMTTTISSIVFPPTIRWPSPPDSPGTQVAFSGMSTPGSTITLYLSNGNSYTAVADANGYWSIGLTLPSDSGIYTVYVVSSQSGGSLSQTSDTYTYHLSSGVSVSPSPSPRVSARPKTPKLAVRSPAPLQSSVPDQIMDVEPTPVTPIFDLPVIIYQLVESKIFLWIILLAILVLVLLR